MERQLGEYKTFLDSISIPDHIKLEVIDLPEYDHTQVVLPVYMRVLKDYAAYRYNPIFNDDNHYPVHIELSGPSVEGDVYHRQSAESRRLESKRCENDGP